MKKQSKNYLSIISLLTSISFFMVLSCQKELHHPDGNIQCTDCNKKPPVADAGPDQVITSRVTVILDGSKSTDPDNSIVSYKWTKISGPSSFSMFNADRAQASVDNLTEGIYQFELKVTDAGGLYDKDTIQIEAGQGVNQKKGNVIFYWPEPVNTVPVYPATGKQSWWLWWNAGSGFNSKIDLLTIKIDSLSGTIAGVWCKDCHTPTCDDFKGYMADDPGTEHELFQLPPGTYTWSAETTIKPFQYSYQNHPGVTSEFFNFFDTPHKTLGTITVNPGDNCIIQKIVFP